VKDSGVPFELPDASERAQRLTSVLHVLYLIFNEGCAGEKLSDRQGRTAAGDINARMRRLAKIFTILAEMTVKPGVALALPWFF